MLTAEELRYRIEFIVSESVLEIMRRLSSDDIELSDDEFVDEVSVMTDTIVKEVSTFLSLKK